MSCFNWTYSFEEERRAEFPKVSSAPRVSSTELSPECTVWTFRIWLPKASCMVSSLASCTVGGSPLETIIADRLPFLKTPTLMQTGVLSVVRHWMRYLNLG